MKTNMRKRSGERKGEGGRKKRRRRRRRGKRGNRMKIRSGEEIKQRIIYGLYSGDTTA